MDLVGFDDFDDDDMSGYGEEIVGAADDDGIDDILAGLGYEEDDELSGEDDDELGAFNLRALARIARMNPRAKAALRAMARRRRRRRPRSGKRLIKVRNNQLRRYPLGLGVTSVGAGASAVISVQPQLPFKLERLVTAVTGFSINNIAVGTVSQFVAAGAVPSEVFAADAVGVSLRGDTAVPGVLIQTTVTNNGGAAADFSGAFIGLVAQ